MTGAQWAAKAAKEVRVRLAGEIGWEYLDRLVDAKEFAGYFERALEEQLAEVEKILFGNVCGAHTEPPPTLEWRCDFCDRIWEAIGYVRRLDPKKREAGA